MSKNLFISVTLSFLLPFYCYADHPIFVTEDLPPLQIEHEDQPPTGALIELMHLVIKEANFSAEIKVYPWARTYSLGQTRKNTFIFSMLRSKEREQKFQWVGKLYTIRSYLAALKSRTDIKVQSLDDAKKYSVGSIRDDLAESYLLANGFIPDKNLYVSSKYPSLWQMLYSGRTDIAFTNSVVWQYEIPKAELNANKLKLIFEIEDFSSDLYLAASPNTDIKLVEAARLALNNIKADGRYDAIMTKWQLD